LISVKKEELEQKIDIIIKRLKRDIIDDKEEYLNRDRTKDDSTGDYVGICKIEMNKVVWKQLFI
jgi:hypothetical protein